MHSFHTCPMSTPTLIDDAVAQFTTMLQHLVIAQVPIKRICPFSWDGWTPRVKELRVQMRHATHRWQWQRTLPHRIAYLKLRRLLNEEIIHNKRFRRRLWCATFNKANPWNYWGLPNLGYSNQLKLWRLKVNLFKVTKLKREFCNRSFFPIYCKLVFGFMKKLMHHGAQQGP